MSNLIWRLRRRLRAHVTRARYRLGRETLPVGRVRINTRFRHPIDVTQREALVARYRELFPEAVRTELEEAAGLLEHRFRLLGHATNHGKSITWSRDPVSGKDWQQAFSPGIPYRGPERLGDIKLPWELNKHQYFFTLGKAAWLSQDATFAREIVRQIDEWIAANPCHRGIHWISALETGTRALSWILAYPFFAEYCDALFTQRMLRSLAQHMLFVEQNLSIDRFANTHLAGEAAILTVGGLFLDCRHSRRWLAKGLAHLNEQAVLQVRADGAHAEQSVAYHRYFLDQYYLVDAMLVANGAALPNETLRMMEQGTQFLMDMLWPDGSAPTFGDGDDARGIWCHAGCPRDYRSLLALGAVRFSRGDFKEQAGAVTEEVLWLHAEKGLARLQALPARPPQHTSAAYPEAGYFVLRGGWLPADPVLVFDCGPLGHGPAGHGHADALSFQLYAGGYPFLIDPGTYSYNLDYRWRDAFRATAAHNTVVVDGQDQSVMQDRMSWRHQARARCRAWQTSAAFDLIDAEHDGYLRLADPVSHRRVVYYHRPDVWLIWDQLTCAETHSYEWLFHLRPDCAFDRDDGGEADFLLSSPAGARLRGWMFLNDSRVEPEMRAGDESRTCAWYSPSYGVKQPARVLSVCRELAGQQTLLTCFSTSDRLTRAALEELRRRLGRECGIS